MAAFSKLPARSLGKNGPLIPRIGLGLMGASGTYGQPLAEAEHLKFLDEAYQRGETLWDTADKYDDSEIVLGKWFAQNPDKRKDVFLATKFGICTNPNAKDGMKNWMDSSPEYCRTAIEKSLKRLGLPYVDLYYVHRLDKVTPIEKTIEAMVALKQEGKIKYIGLSECSADSLRRAHAVHPISCVQVEYSVFCTEIESPKVQLLLTARELGVAIVAYSPLGNGFLSGAIRSREDVSKPGDVRGVLPWLRKGNIEKNVAVVDQLAEIAKGKGMTTAQLALAWLFTQGDDIFAIPGTSKIHRLEENLASLSFQLSEEEEQTIRRIAQSVVGVRFQALTGFDFADTPPL
ncbi:aldo-keto reductase [Aspergillus tubingensis]|uniref:aldo-keto reductase n=1 Tax=Aspergillus tubingensis TaxID=5068 RepID=UPI001579C8BA|nr:aldo-keto reductase [Aspergillus tubingensis]GFN12487.1 aldo-keto reductase [Aspergillus tubingensis]GLB19808.1 hypothetical protein AtubIFM61612_009729 [Aspergillus tubingensis]